ncbi:uncharacterized protein LOC130790251 [Actinidia eriantha]|uniref:uncharacterized protein LOC130790251 n=1 Tax=Actinidia eriantha TaxID=165200 RepID=UPI00258AF297|nr:uncharacterized protein LOC130790251 [Actinidia eriantha]
MPRQIVLRHPSSVNRRHPLLASSKSSSVLSSPSVGGGNEVGRAGIGEVAGGTAAECAAVCCCCPCALVELVVLTVYKLPAGLCRRALRQKRRRRLAAKGLLPRRSCRRRCDCGCDETDLQIHPVTANSDMSPPSAVRKVQLDTDVVRLEREMWDRFDGTGFWRSPSQRSNH